MRLATSIVALLLLFAGPAAAGQAGIQDAAAAPAESLDGSDAELIERILELRSELEELEQQLSPESRRILEARILALETARVEEAAAAVAETGPAAVEVARSRPDCNTLLAFDTSDDGIVSGADRYWRYLKLWVDADRDGQREPAEIIHPFDLGIIDIPVDLKRFHEADNVSGEIQIDDRLRFVPVGDKGETGVLAVETTRIRRGDGLDFRSPAGEALEGVQEFQPGLKIVAASGAEVEINCP